MDAQQPIPQSPTIQPSNHSSSSVTVISVALFILLSLGVIAFLYYQNQQLKSMLAKYQSTNQQINQSPTPTATADPTVNWKTYTFSSTISLKIPTEINDLKYVNVGHYAVETILPGGKPCKFGALMVQALLAERTCLTR